MDRKVKSFRVRVDLLDWIESYATSRGSSQIAVLESAVETFRGLSQGGVPDLPVADTPEVRQQRADAVPVSSLDGSAADHLRWRAERQAKLNEAKERASR